MKFVSKQAKLTSTSSTQLNQQSRAIERKLAERYFDNNSIFQVNHQWQTHTPLDNKFGILYSTDSRNKKLEIGDKVNEASTKCSAR